MKKKPEVCPTCGQRTLKPHPLRVITRRMYDGGWMPDLATAIKVGTMFNRGRGRFAIVPADYPFRPWPRPGQQDD